MRKGSQNHPTSTLQKHLEMIQISEANSNIEQIEQEAQSLPNYVEEELGLNIEKYSAEIKQEIRYLLMDLLRYPSSSDAQLHRCSNRLGYYDIKHIMNKQVAESKFYPSHHHRQYCKDCGLVVQERQIAICSSVWQFPKAGLATFHFFQNIKTLGLFLFVLGVVFSIFSLYTNIVEPTLPFTLDVLPIKVSYSAKMQYSASNSILLILLQIEGWLNVLAVVIWWFLLFAIRCLQQKYQRLVDLQNLSAADFSLMMQGVPINYTRQILQKEFNLYFDSLVYKHNLKNTWGERLMPFQIQSINRVVPFRLSADEVMDKQLDGLDRDILEKRQLFAEWMIEFKENSKFTRSKAERKREYEQFEKMLDRRKQKVQQMEQRARQQYERLNNVPSTTFFISFKCNQSAMIIADLNPQLLTSQLRYWLSCCRTAHYFKVRDQSRNQELNIRISLAPAPEEIIWGNLEIPLKSVILPKIVTWLVVMMLLGTTFGIAYGLNSLKTFTGFSYMAAITAIQITLMSMIIKFAIRKLSHYERYATETNRQKGIIFKTVLSLIINWTLTPIVIGLVVQGSSFADDGLVYLIFYLSITNAFLPPFFRFIDPLHFLNKLIACWKDRPYQKLKLTQKQLNYYFQHEQHDLGWAYVYFIDLFYFTCFYATMHPGTVITSLLGYILMFWAEKYCLLHRSKRPSLISRDLTQAAVMLMTLGPLVVGSGGLLWVCIFQLDFSSLAFIAYISLIGLSVLFYLSPVDSIYKCLYHIPEQEILIFEECKRKMATDYQRLNPATTEQGIKDYMTFLQQKKDDQKATLLNRSQDNINESFDINLMIDGMSKIPNIFGKYNQITKRIDKNDLSPERKTSTKQLVSPSKELTYGKQDVIVRNNTPEIKLTEDFFQIQKNQDKISRAGTEGKNVMSINSSGNTYIRRKHQTDRKTISVLEGTKGYDYKETHF